MTTRKRKVIKVGKNYLIKLNQQDLKYFELEEGSIVDINEINKEVKQNGNK